MLPCSAPQVNVALLAEPERSTLEAARHAAAASAAVQGTTAEGLPQSLLQQLSSPGTASLVGQAGLEAQRTAAAPGLVTRSASQPAAAAGKGPMIVELQPDIKPSEEFASQGAAGLDDAAHGCLTVRGLCVCGVEDISWVCRNFYQASARPRLEVSGMATICFSASGSAPRI